MKFIALIMLVHYYGADIDGRGVHVDDQTFDSYAECMQTVGDVAAALKSTPEKNQIEAFACVSNTGRDMGFPVLIRNVQAGPS